jgi:ATPase subunit of ABC transporter with duplicated ATPase domains
MSNERPMMRREHAEHNPRAADVPAPRTVVDGARAIRSARDLHPPRCAPGRPEPARRAPSKLNDQITRSEAALASAQAKLAQADATAHEARATLERLQEVSRLSGGKAPSKTEFATAEAAIARAPVSQPVVLLAGEPRGNLDTQRDREVLGLLAALNRDRGLTILIVTHDPEALRHE